MIGVNVFQLDGKEWRPLDYGKGSRVAIIESTEGRFRVIALAINNEVANYCFLICNYYNST
jgi:hypothetical protein